MKHIQMPHIGMRKLKSILAMIIGFGIWQLIRLAFPDLELHPIFIYIYSMIEIRDSSAKTVDLGKTRIKATFVALGVGLPILALVVFLQPMITIPWMYAALEVAMILIGTLLTLIIAEKAGCKAFCGLAAAIYIILIVGHANDGRYLYAFLRSLQTIIGVLVAWLVNVKLFPYPGKKKEA